MATAGDIMDMAAALQNDINKDRYSYTAQLPFLKMAWRKLCNYLQAHDVPVLDEVSTVITYTAGETTIDKPADLLIPFALFERDAGSTDDSAWIRMDEGLWEPLQEPDIYLGKWSWRELELKVRACSRDRDVLIRYAKDISSQISASASTINVDNAYNYLGFKTGEYLAAYIGVNPGRAAALRAEGDEEKDLILTIATKQQQFRRVRRKGYRIGIGPRFFPRPISS